MEGKNVLLKTDKLQKEIEKAVNDLVAGFEKDHPYCSCSLKTIHPKDGHKKVEVCVYFNLDKM